MFLANPGISVFFCAMNSVPFDSERWLVVYQQHKRVLKGRVKGVRGVVEPKKVCVYVCVWFASIGASVLKRLLAILHSSRLQVIYVLSRTKVQPRGDIGNFV